MNAPAEPLAVAMPHPPGWQASLQLRVAKSGDKSVLAHRLHCGPLRVQKPLYPEGDALCQILLLHPPAGIAGGDQLKLDVRVDSGAHAQLTTPGATKWYRSLGVQADQRIDLNVAEGAVLEWLPQEAIVFDGALANNETVITLADHALLFGWDIVCLGRAASGEKFSRGRYRQRLRLQGTDGSPIWREALTLQGSDAALQSAVALGGKRVFGNLWIAGVSPNAELLEGIRALAQAEVTAAATALPKLTVVRVLSDSPEAARNYFESVWRLTRPLVLGREAVIPRIWRT